MSAWAREQARVLAAMVAPVWPIAAAAWWAIGWLCGGGDQSCAVLAILTAPLWITVLFVAPLFALIGTTCTALALRAPGQRDGRDALAAAANAVNLALALAVWLWLTRAWR
jgi:hypothetical protein